MAEESSFYRRQQVVTGDGSVSIYLPELDEHYHSRHGAVQESKHVFMKMGWEEVTARQNDVRILEIGFGTGLNAWLVFEAIGNNKDLKAHYTSLEAYPVSEEDAEKLNYTSASQRNSFLGLHRAPWNEEFRITEDFILEKRKQTLESFEAEPVFDLIFFDAFAPRVQPELWTEDVFRKMVSVMKPGAVLVTYCSKGDVRRNMQAAGLLVEKLPGPPGKREMLRARKSM